MDRSFLSSTVTSWPVSVLRTLKMSWGKAEEAGVRPCAPCQSTAPASTSTHHIDVSPTGCTSSVDSTEDRGEQASCDTPRTSTTTATRRSGRHLVLLVSCLTSQASIQALKHALMRQARTVTRKTTDIVCIALTVSTSQGAAAGPVAFRTRQNRFSRTSTRKARGARLGSQDMLRYQYFCLKSKSSSPSPSSWTLPGRCRLRLRQD